LLVVLKELLKSRFAFDTFLSSDSNIDASFQDVHCICYNSPLLLQDFGDSIPGHGGITDRMDCQVSFDEK